MFDAVKALLEEHQLWRKAGTFVDATIIGAPSSTKHATKTRDPEMRQTTQGNPWYFGMKGHVGTDRRGVIHALTTTDAATADIAQSSVDTSNPATDRHRKTGHHAGELRLVIGMR
jgi:IS5 family transposase